MRFTLRLALATVLVLAVTTYAQAPNVEQELIKVQDELVQSVQGRDPAAYSRATADDWVAIEGDGAVVTKKQRMDQVKNAATTAAAQAPAAPVYYKRLEYKVRASGDTAITTWKNPPSANEPGGSIQARVWVRRDGRWQQMHIQTTRLPGNKK